jgi:hypothetical protein
MCDSLCRFETKPHQNLVCAVIINEREERRNEYFPREGLGKWIFFFWEKKLNFWRGIVGEKQECSKSMCGYQPPGHVQNSRNWHDNLFMLSTSSTPACAIFND